jgi:hypothetical protein
MNRFNTENDHSGHPVDKIIHEVKTSPKFTFSLKKALFDGLPPSGINSGQGLSQNLFIFSIINQAEELNHD